MKLKDFRNSFTQVFTLVRLSQRHSFVKIIELFGGHGLYSFVRNNKKVLTRCAPKLCEFVIVSLISK